MPIGGSIGDYMHDERMEREEQQRKVKRGNMTEALVHVVGLDRAKLDELNYGTLQRVYDRSKELDELAKKEAHDKETDAIIETLK